MPEPTTIAALAIGGLTATGLAVLSGAIGGAVGNPTDRAVVAALRGMKDRIAGLRGLPENHDVAKAVRTAQIQALEHVIRDYRNGGRSDWVTEPYRKPDYFFDRSLGFCRAQIGRCHDLRVKINLDVTESLAAAIDGLLGEPARGGSAHRRADAIEYFCETAVLAELERILEGIILPEGFEEHFRRGIVREGRPSRSRFIDLFGHYIAEQVKENHRFRAILTLGKLAHIESLAFEATEMLAHYAPKFDSMLSTIGEIKAMVSNLSAERGVPVATLERVLSKFGQACSTSDLGEIERVLGEKADEYLSMAERLHRPSNDDPAVRRLRADAKRAIDAGLFDHAESLLKQAEERDRDIAQELSETAQRRLDNARESRMLRAELALLQSDYEEAATHYLEARGLAGEDMNLRWRLGAKAAKILLYVGRIHQWDCLDEAIEVYRELRERRSADLTAAEVWDALAGYAVSLQILDERKPNVTHIERYLEITFELVEIAWERRDLDRCAADLWALSDQLLGVVLLQGERIRRAKWFKRLLEQCNTMFESLDRESAALDQRKSERELNEAGSHTLRHHMPVLIRANLGRLNDLGAIKWGIPIAEVKRRQARRRELSRPANGGEPGTAESSS